MKKNKYFFDGEMYSNFILFVFKDHDTKEFKRFAMYQHPDFPDFEINDTAALVAFIKQDVGFLIGYNNEEFDNPLLNYIVKNEERLTISHIKLVISEIFELSQRIIKRERHSKPIPEVYGLRRCSYFRSIDEILLFNTIDRVGLKKLAINLRWPIVMDLPWGPYHVVLPDQIGQIVYYCENDVNITERVLQELAPKINDRIVIGKRLGLDVVNKCDTDIGKAVLSKYYEEATGIPYRDFSKLRTERKHVILGDVISSKVRFQTKNYNKIIDKLKLTKVNPNVKESPGSKKKKKQFEHIFASKYLTHTMGLGGLHSNNPPEIFEENDNYYLIDVDVSSYYPWLMVNENLCPAHLQIIFLKIYRDKILLERMTAKKAKDEVIALMLKYAANTTYGLTKSDHSWLKDAFVTLGTCINGELFLLMLIEALEMYSKCMVIYSNTDGLTVRVPKNEYFLFRKICNQWESATHLELEFNRYKKMIVMDVNNYLMFTYKTGKDELKPKGRYSWKKDLTKGYDFPIIATAIRDYFKKGTPMEDTIRGCKDVYEFMKAENTSIKKFKVLFLKKDSPFNEAPTELQKNNRWIVTNNNPGEGKIFKQSLEDAERSEMQKGFMVTPLNNVPEGLTIEDYKINYDFYINEAVYMAWLKPFEGETHVVPIMEQQQLFYKVV